jgi:hypothetical protein
MEHDLSCQPEGIPDELAPPEKKRQYLGTVYLTW